MRHVKISNIIQWFYNTNLSKLIILFAPPAFILLLLFQPIREILTPFILAALAAYLLEPVVQFLWKRLYIPRIASILFIFILLVLVIVFLAGKLISIANVEIRELAAETKNISTYTEALPDWGQGIVLQTVGKLNNATQIGHVTTLSFLESTVNKIIHLFAFFIAVFYFLKDSDKLHNNISKFTLYKNIDKVLQSYFRGQLLLILIMSTLTWIFLTFLGVKFSLVLGIFTGIAEIIPYVGPIMAATATIIITLVTGGHALGMTPVLTVAFIAAGYFILRQVEDFFIIPVVLSKSVHLHPLIILFTTLIAGKLFGLMGLVLGVPFIATYKVIIEYVFNIPTIDLPEKHSTEV